MNIEEITFKDRTELAHLNGIDLVNIIEFLQKDRKQWINQFTQTHNESVEIQKEINELKKQVEEYKEQVNKGLYNTCLPYTTGYNKAIKDKETQQKEFINYLEKRYKDVTSVIGSFGSNTDLLYGKKYMLEEILQKYKEITGK